MTAAFRSAKMLQGGVTMNKCPICNENDLHPDEVMNSLSRKDNETYICNPCAVKEAMEDAGLQ